ncbi:importin subunit alpha-2 [Neodiprion fabricii]|uniref:importin subunit alpha-2 n=1 Tax=Neodiprion fabricii TaxID=2872261 RepID=UPI001ED95F8D|nr:importin subunit alpha-2 [Neodiprion fabricii]
MSETTTNQRTDELRQELRETSWIERKYHRSLELNKNRPALGESIPNECYTEEFVKSKAQILKKKPLRLKEYQHLQNAFLQSEENINAFLSVDNALHALVRELSGCNPDLQLAAANCYCNLALGNSKACNVLAKAAGPYLLATLDSLNYNLMDICIWTIGNLAAGSEKAFEIVYAQGCLRLLISLLRECDLTLLPSVIYATMHCVYAGYEHIQDSEIVHVTKAIVCRQSHYHDPNTLWLLAILSSKSTCVEHILILLSSLIEYLHNATKSEFSDVVQVTAVVRILANVICEATGEAVDALFNNPKHTETETQLLLNKLLMQPHLHLQKETLWLIGNLYNHPSLRHREQARSLICTLSSLRQAALSTGASL